MSRSIDTIVFFISILFHLWLLPQFETQVTRIITSPTGSYPVVTKPRRLRRQAETKLSFHIASRPKSPVVGEYWTPNVTRYGTWSEWKYCEGESFVDTVIGQSTFPKHDSDEKDTLGLAKITVQCKDIHGVMQTGFTHGINGAETDTITCQSPAKGFQLRQLGDMGCMDDMGATNLKLECSSTVRKEVQFSSTSKFQNLGEWTTYLKCPMYSALCGMKVQYDSRAPISRNSASTCFKPAKDKDDHNKLGVDATAINNVAIACCELDDPAFLCDSKLAWRSIRNCTNGGRCNFRLRTGLIYHSNVPDRLKASYEALGFSISSSRATLANGFVKRYGRLFAQPKYNRNITDSFKNLGTNSDMNIVISNCTGEIRQPSFECRLPEVKDASKYKDLYVFNPAIYVCYK